MKAIKRKISLFLAGLMVASAVSVMPTKAEGTTAMPTNVKFFNAHREVIAGDEMGVFVTSEAEGQVQYKVWFYDAEGNWTQTEYSEAVDASVPYYMELPSTFKEGQNTISVWVKRADVEVTETEHYKDDVKSGYDAFNYSHLFADKDGFSAGEKIDYTMDGKTVTINGVTGVEEGSEFKVYFYDYANSKWGEISTEWSGEPVEYTFEEEGYYLLDVQINKVDSDEKYDALRMEVINVVEKAGTEVSFSTELDTTPMFGANMTVATESTDVATYRIFKDGAEITSEAAAINEATLVFPKPAAGDDIVVKFYDASNAIVGEAATTVGGEGTFSIEEKEVKEYAVEAVLDTTPMFGANITVTNEDSEVATYRVFKDGAEITSEAAAINEATLVFPKPAVGDAIKVQLFDANEALLGEVETTIK